MFVCLIVRMLARSYVCLCACLCVLVCVCVCPFVCLFVCLIVHVSRQRENAIPARLMALRVLHVCNDPLQPNFRFSCA